MKVIDGDIGGRDVGIRKGDVSCTPVVFGPSPNNPFGTTENYIQRKIKLNDI